MTENIDTESTKDIVAEVIMKTENNEMVEAESCQVSIPDILDIGLLQTTYVTYISQPVTIDCRITGGLEPYTPVSWFKNVDDDPITITPFIEFNRAVIVSEHIGTYIIYVTVSDAEDTTSSKQFTLEVKDTQLTLNIDPSSLKLDVGDTAKLTLKFNRERFETDESGWCENSDGYVFETKTHTKAVIKALKEGSYDLSAWASTIDGTIFDHSTITVHDNYPTINYIIGTIEYIKTINNCFYDWVIKNLRILKYNGGN